MRLVFFGPPGSGKGTQAKMVSDRLGIPQISTGDILREAVARGSDLGKKARSYMDAGKLVPDDIMLSLIEKRTGEADCAKGYILDGFPRTLAQAIGLDEILSQRHESIDLAILIEVSDETVITRLTRRRVCPQCHALYNLDTDPPKDDNRCDRCGVELVLRSDDEETTVRTRLNVYRNDTLPLADYYESRGILRRIDGEGRVEEVFDAIMEALTEVRQS